MYVDSVVVERIVLVCCDCYGPDVTDAVGSAILHL